MFSEACSRAKTKCFAGLVEGGQRGQRVENFNKIRGAQGCCGYLYTNYTTQLPNSIKKKAKQVSAN